MIKSCEWKENYVPLMLSVQHSDIPPKNPPQTTNCLIKIEADCFWKEWKDCEHMDCITAFKLLGNMKRCSFQGQFFVFVCYEEIWGLKEWEVL